MLYNCFRPTLAYIINNIYAFKSIHGFNTHLNTHYWTGKDISINTIRYYNSDNLCRQVYEPVEDNPDQDP